MCLTYSQTDLDLTNDVVLEKLRSVLPIQEYTIGKEPHKNGSIHFHAVLKAIKKFDIRSPSRWDITFNGKTYHGHYKPVINWTGCIEYAAKKGDYISNISNREDGKFLKFEEALAIMSKGRGMGKTIIKLP